MEHLLEILPVLLHHSLSSHVINHRVLHRLLSFSVKAHHTVNNYLSALRRLHVFCHFDTSAFNDIHVKLTQKGFEKSMVHLPHRKAPLTPAILLQFYCHLNICDSAHLALWCALLVGFFSFFRSANLVPRSFEKFSTHQALSRGSVTFASSGALLTVTRTKTRQAGDTALVVPVPHIPGSPLCPTTALHFLLNSVSAPASHPLFTYTTASHQHDCITATSLNNSIKHLASLVSLIHRTSLVTACVAGVPPSHFNAGFPQSSSKSKAIGDLMLICCI